MVICPQIGKTEIWSRARGNSILQHDSLGQIPHAQLLLRPKYGQHLFPDWAQNVSVLLLKWKRAWAFEHYSTGQTCQINLCPVIWNNFSKSLIFCFGNGVCCNVRHWRQQTDKNSRCAVGKLAQECWLQLRFSKRLPTSWKRSVSFWSSAIGRLGCWEGPGQLSCAAVHLNSGQSLGSPR